MQLNRFVFVVLCGMLLLPVRSSFGSESSIRCFTFQREVAPFSGSITNAETLRDESWCYFKSTLRSGSILSIRLWGEKSDVTADLLAQSARVETNEQDQVVSIVYSIQNAGKRRWLKLANPEFSPIPVPMTIADAVREAKREIPAPDVSDEWLTAITLDLGWSSVAFETFNGVLREPALGVSESYVPNDRLPWRGYWWPYEGATIARGNASPLGKYEQFVAARTGVRSGAAEWDLKYHSLSGVEWGGHCNGWAAASILYPEPKRTTRDSRTGVEFGVGDQKALLTELSYCVQYTMWGRRFNGGAGDELMDIDPKLFHQLVVHYLGELKQPLVVEYVPGVRVDNHIATGYKMNVRRAENNRFRVDLDLRMAGYDRHFGHSTGSAPFYLRSYQYDLQADANGNIVWGQWRSENADFLWLPTAPLDCGSSYENPYLSSGWVNEILTQ